MGNRRKPKRPDLTLAGGPGVSLPEEEHVLVKTVPAVIHWSQFKDIDREDTEIVGETFIYENGTHDIVLADDISEDAKIVMGYYGKLKNLSVDRENN